MTIPENAVARGAVLKMVLDLIGEKAEHYAKLGKKCLDCPLLVELVKDIRLANLQDDEYLTDATRGHYGL